jgi:hypothetical protein
MFPTESFVANHAWLGGKLQYNCLTPDGSQREVVGYYDDGKIRFRFPILIDGKFHGIGRIWYPSGRIEWEKSYRRGMLQGLSKRWHENGNLALIENFLNGGRHGIYREWHDNGVVSLESHYLDNRREGILSKHDLDGKIIKQEVYVRGSRIEGELKELMLNDKLTAKYIMTINSVIVRRFCLVWLTYSRLLTQLPYKVIDRDGDNELIKIKWHKREAPLYLVKVRCASLQIFYVLRVPPGMKTVKESIAWTFGVPADKYYLDGET